MTTVTRSLSRNRAILFGYLLVVVLAIVGEIVSSGFLRINHIDELIIPGGFIALVGVGQTFVILTGGVDLSIPWVLNASAVFLTLWAKGDSAKMAWRTDSGRRWAGGMAGRVTVRARSAKSGGGDQRPVTVKEQAISLRPVAAADDVHVARAAGDDEAGLGSLSLDQRVDGDGRAMDQLVDGRGGESAPADAIDDALHQVSRRGEALRLHEAACCIFQPDQISEGASDIDRNNNHAIQLRSTSCSRRHDAPS